MTHCPASTSQTMEQLDSGHCDVWSPPATDLSTRHRKTPTRKFTSCKRLCSDGISSSYLLQHSGNTRTQLQRTKISSGFSEPGYQSTRDVESVDTLGLVLKPPPRHQLLRPVDISNGCAIESITHSRSIRSSRPSTSSWLRQLPVWALLFWLATTAVVVGAVKDDAVPVDGKYCSRNVLQFWDLFVLYVTDDPVDKTVHSA
ncbi:hypothetical protein ElyMa_003177500 [Elysia marginata]|uniref:Uncharacterized protein n=1 Tax=Elysia marginata TaxID=1093978 RepID=A0AAV4IWZ6_9GAST|nr:hypothetical protein ElyMa_003177500 [Elysia marginata]